MFGLLACKEPRNRSAFVSGAWGPPKIFTKTKEKLRESGLKFWLPNKTSVAPRDAPRVELSHNSGPECNCKSCPENAPEFRDLLREWPFHSESWDSLALLQGSFGPFGPSQKSSK